MTSASYDPVRMYLREIRKVPLLTAAEEVDLAMRIEGGELAAELLAALSPGRPGRGRHPGAPARPGAEAAP